MVFFSAKMAKIRPPPPPGPVGQAPPPREMTEEEKKADDGVGVFPFATACKTIRMLKEVSQHNHMSSDFNITLSSLEARRASTRPSSSTNRPT